MDTMRIAVVMGGVSAERDVSLNSGARVAEALREAGHDVAAIDLRRESIAPILEARPDVAFLALHGRFGEDGAIQALLEEAGVPFTGSDAAASATGMDKVASKRAFIMNDVPTPPFRCLHRADSWARLSAAIGELGLPLVVKPPTQGSSIGVTMVDDLDGVGPALAEAFCYGDAALLEERIYGREFTVGILDDHALPVLEIRTARGFFDNEAKYSDCGTEYILDPALDELTRGVIQDLAVRAHRAVGCRDLSRVDFILSGDGMPYVLEVNTIPGFTSHSLLPQAARAEGIEFVALCDRIARLALAHAVNGSSQFSVVSHQ